MRSRPLAGAVVSLAPGGAAEGADPADGSSLHAPTSAQTTIDEHRCTALLMESPFPPWAPREPGPSGIDCRAKQRANSNAMTCDDGRGVVLRRRLRLCTKLAALFVLAP